jgi:hypothetical protein
MSLSVGEVLDGDRMTESLYKFNFRENTEKNKSLPAKSNREDVFAFGLNTHNFTVHCIIERCT